MLLKGVLKVDRPAVDQIVYTADADPGIGDGNPAGPGANELDGLVEPRRKRRDSHRAKQHSRRFEEPPP